MKRLIACILAFTVGLLAVGCQKQPTVTDTVPESTESMGLPMTVTDDLGRQVTVSSLDRVASMLGSYADMWLLAGGQICATVDDAWEDLKLPLAEDTVNIGSAHRPNREKLLAAQPTLVLASSKLSKQVELKESLEGAGIPVAYFDVGDFEAYLRVLRLMTDLTGNPAAYEQYGTRQETAIRAAIDRQKSKEPQKVLVLRASASSIRAKNSDGTMLGGMLRDFGCENIADSDAMLLENLNIESILQRNPDKIFLVETGDDREGIRKNVEAMFRENPLWQQVEAVKNDRLYYMDKMLYNLKPNARFTEAYEKLEKILAEP